MQQEVGEAIEQLSNNKRPGSDNIPEELIKNGGGVRVLWGAVHKLVWEIWNQNDLPDEWNMRIICTIHKKGYDMWVCSNYLTLLNTAYEAVSYTHLAVYKRQ